MTTFNNNQNGVWVFKKEKYMTLHSLALELETTARKIMNFNDSPIGTIYDSNSIEYENFIEVMVILLKVKNNFTADEKIEIFANKYNPYARKSMNDMGIETANAIYNEFKRLLASI